MKIKTFDEKIIDLDFTYSGNPDSLLALPALVDPHVHFRVPGGEHKEDWKTGAKAAIYGGVTTVLEMPNTTPPIITAASLHEKKQKIDAQLAEADIPLHYGLYFGATATNLNEIRAVKNGICGIKMFMGSSTGNLLVDKKSDQEATFALAAELGLVLAIHAEDELTIKKNQERLSDNDSIKVHSLIRDRFVATKAVEQALGLAKYFGTKLYILHVSTKEEVDLIRKAKEDVVTVFAETTPHHLFLDTESYQILGTKAQMNPPLRTPEDQRALWAGIEDGTIDTVGTDHAPHTLEEKSKPYPNSPSGVPGIETSLPLLLSAYHKNKISLDNLVKVTSTNAKNIFNLPETNDWVIVDLNLEKEVRNEELKTKCGWSPFVDWKLRGWPVATILNNKVYPL